MGEEKTIKLTIHYGGEMEKLEDDYKYLNELGCASVFWKLSEIGWMKFEDYSRSECFKAPINIIWFIPRGVGTFWSPFTGRPFQVVGDKAYDMSNNDPQRPL